MRRSGIVRVALLGLFWGSSFLWIKLALRGFTPVQIVWVRLALGALVLTPIALARGLRFPTDRMVWVHLFVAALISNAIPYVLFGVGEQTIGSNVAGILNATTPLWTVVLAYVAGTDRTFSPRRGIGIALGFAGTMLIFSPWQSAGEIASWGGLACLLASASYGIGFVYMGRFIANRGIPPLMLSASQLAAATVLLTLVMPFAGRVAPTFRLDALVSLLILGAVGTGLAYVLNYRIITDDGPVVASTVLYLLPVVAIVLGALVVNEPITLTIVAGMVLVLGGIALAQRRTTAPTATPVART